MPRRGTPLPQGRPHLVLRRQLHVPVREARVRRVPDRRARHRLVAGRRARRVPGGRAARPARRVRLARRPGLVRRADRHVGDVVLRLQLAADRVRTPAAAQGDLRDLRHRRPVDRRRALARRRAQARRSRRLLPLHDARCACCRPCRRSGATTGARSGTRRLEVNEPWVLTWLRENRHGAYWNHGSVRLGRDGVGLRADRVPGHDRRRLGGRVPQQLLPHRRRARAPRRAAPAARRTVGARRPHHRDARSADRLRRRAGRVVRPLAARHRRRTRTAATSSSARPRSPEVDLDLHEGSWVTLPSVPPVDRAGDARTGRAADAGGRHPTSGPRPGSTAPATCRGDSPATSDWTTSAR